MSKQKNIYIYRSLMTLHENEKKNNNQPNKQTNKKKKKSRFSFLIFSRSPKSLLQSLQ